MFLEKLPLEDKQNLETLFESGDFTDYDFTIVVKYIDSARELLEFYRLFLKHDCLENNLHHLKAMTQQILKKSQVIVYEAILLKKDTTFNDIFVAYKDIITQEVFEYRDTSELLRKSKEIIDAWKNEIIIYNSINHALWKNNARSYYNFILQILDERNKLNYREIKHIIELLIYSSNLTLQKAISQVSNFLVHEYDIEFPDKKIYFYSLSYKIIDRAGIKK